MLSAPLLPALSYYSPLRLEVLHNQEEYNNRESEGDGAERAQCIDNEEFKVGEVDVKENTECPPHEHEQVHLLLAETNVFEIESTEKEGGRDEVEEEGNDAEACYGNA